MRVCGQSPLDQIRHEKGFALFYWWLFWTSLAIKSFQLHLTKSIVNALGRIGNL